MPFKFNIPDADKDRLLERFCYIVDMALAHDCAILWMNQTAQQLADARNDWVPLAETLMDELDDRGLYPGEESVRKSIIAGTTEDPRGN